VLPQYGLVEGGQLGLSGSVEFSDLRRGGMDSAARMHWPIAQGSLFDKGDAPDCVRDIACHAFSPFCSIQIQIVFETYLYVKSDCV
jgi:hypothetical protein